MSSDGMRWLLAFAAATFIASVARSRRSLRVDGMIAAIALGTSLVGTAGWWSGLLLVTFFVTSTLLSRANRRATIVQARGSERDAVQVLANGGCTLIAAVAWVFLDHPALIVALAGTLAAANADTWSTEIGRTSRQQPRLITTGRRVPAGTSGAVSRRGLAGALGGSTLIGVLAAIGWETGYLGGDLHPIAATLAVVVGGVGGSLLDSILGATLQDQRWCEHCQKTTERRVHLCGNPTRPIRGIGWINNDVVNVACAASGGIGAALLYLVL